MTSEHQNAVYPCLRFENFLVYYNNLDSLHDILQEVFEHECYKFYTDKTEPQIIDAGSNIGIATLFFKKQYPNAKIICFEPDPNAFEVLKQNIAANHLDKITAINTALASNEGTIDFYGQIFVDNPDARGNSIIAEWGNQRAISNKIQVPSTRLSSFINNEIDLLKLDIEGAEQQVLENIADKLVLVKELIIEVHQAHLIQNVNDLNIITDILKKHGFLVDILKKDLLPILPAQISQWVQKVKPDFYILRAKKL